MHSLPSVFCFFCSPPISLVASLVAILYVSIWYIEKSRDKVTSAPMISLHRMSIRGSNGIKSGTAATGIWYCY